MSTISSAPLAPFPTQSEKTALFAYKISIKIVLLCDSGVVIVGFALGGPRVFDPVPLVCDDWRDEE
jgi:hypothetical protein